MERFVTALNMALHEVNPALPLQPAKHWLFRINRDVRFSKDKAPYKTHTACYFSVGGKQCNLPGFYAQLGGAGSFCAGGCYEVAPADLKLIRQEIVYQPDEFRALISAPDFAEAFGELQGERNKILPAEFKEEAATQPLLYLKQFFYTRPLSPEEITSPDLVQRLADLYRIAQPFDNFLTRAIMG
jgi:uncharacterized protein (TIGR02453 family)